ncbi:MAG: phosphate/phosphite/phosphonate ABC transporter substrate-binding protein [Candidatus Electrothrix sp. AR4]|nr:phosphate/phosphite/phosphonate ABC transporter substrate-binding protein [Candidatus Electrothrix sp. AR4]
MLKKLKKNRLLGIVFFIFLTSLFSDSGAVRAHADDELLIGTGPYYNADKLRKGFTPIINHLSEKLDKKIIFTVTKSYEELAKKVKKGAIDIGFFGPALYVELKQIYPKLKYLVTSQSSKGGKKTAYYYSWLISRKDSGITKVKHLRGKSFAFTDKYSSSGYVYPLGYFKKRNLVPEDFFAQIIFAGTHENVTDMIAQKKVASGVSYDTNLWNAEEKHGRIFRRIKKIGPIIGPSFAARHQVDNSTCKQIIFALENLPTEVFNKDLAYTGFQRLSEKNFAAVADLLIPLTTPGKTSPLKSN